VVTIANGDESIWAAAAGAPGALSPKGWGGRGTKPAAARAGSFAYQAAAQPSEYRFAPKPPCWPTLAASLHIANTGRGLVVDVVLPGTAF